MPYLLRGPGRPLMWQHWGSFQLAGIMAALAVGAVGPAVVVSGVRTTMSPPRIAVAPTNPPANSAKKGADTREFIGIAAAVKDPGPRWHYNGSPSSDAMSADAQLCR